MRGVPDPFPWSDVSGQVAKPEVPRTASAASVWKQVISQETDSDGWQYAVSWKGPFTAHAVNNAVVRRRKWKKYNHSTVCCLQQQHTHTYAAQVLHFFLA